MKIESYLHYCIVREGDMAGSRVIKEVTSLDIEYGTECEHCGRPLATPEQIVAFLYDRLTS